MRFSFNLYYFKYDLTLLLKNVDPDQMASEKSADKDQHYACKYILTRGHLLVN